MKGSDEYDSIRLEYVLEIGQCLVEKGMYQETIMLLSNVEITSILKHSNASTLLRLFFRTGCIDRAIDLYRYWSQKNTAKNITSLPAAASWGQTEVVKLMLDMSADIDTTLKENGWTALSYASYNGNVPLVRLLLERGANVHSISAEEYTPLQLALVKGHVDVVQCILDRGIPIDFAHQKFGYLLRASKQGFTPMVRLLIDQGASINGPSTLGQTPLILASESGHIEIIKILLDEGADIEHKCNDTLTALQWANSNGHGGCVRLLLEYGASPVPEVGKGTDYNHSGTQC
ncbi:ankyrin repeat-containing domain protein [Hypoxylon fuscum]|nr:ankyrin repeat-containing domain protein [Hypoxylon fuscum]